MSVLVIQTDAIMVEAKKGRLMSKNEQDNSAAINSFSTVYHSGKQYSENSSCVIM